MKYRELKHFLDKIKENVLEKETDKYERIELENNFETILDLFETKEEKIEDLNYKIESLEEDIENLKEEIEDLEKENK